ncbi:hypothetical protein L0Z72_13505 [candidate division KSB1 bacterium]|nr:hypothetical protein [candidate division KSB1 bacterium]
MDYQLVDILDDKINKIIKLIELLRSENQELKLINQKLIEQLKTREQAQKELQVKFDELAARQDEFIQAKAREVQIRERVENMLEKLELLQL